ncbi:MAG: transferase [Deltaproteobacteria bacterium HGW-Deltaproteobacteria-17]|nr:MAG: transferase [Deltaproteobacteria bacterium HGW-Deltaproteobacteria-17]PKO84592.1 MAG: transferase [Betaproteobacteria bacterium HGW-Betaproteobacteria-11]
MPETHPGHPFVSRNRGRLSLHFDYLAIQSEMRLDTPEALALGYTRTMMGFLLFQPQPAEILMIGLGGGSLAKYCRRHLPATRFTAIEVNPAILEFRQAFQIPDDGPNFRVIIADGADYLRREVDRTADVLLLDGFDGHSPPPQLCTAEFYADCHACLSDDGVLVANFWSGDRDSARHLARLRECFAGQVLPIDACEPGNKIVFAGKGRDFPPAAERLLARAVEPDPQHPIRLHATARKLLRQLRQMPVRSRESRADRAGCRTIPPSLC